jgi:hypothetical protein
MKRLLPSLLLIASSQGFALETKPWFGDKYAFNFESVFTYSRFHKVEGASVQLSSPLNNRDLLFDVGFNPSAVFDMQLETEFAKTTEVNWALRSAALQGRYQVFDDISGDPVSLALGLNIRAAPHHFLRDVSTPYAAEFNTEVTGALGKEWSKAGQWQMRTYGFVALGIANRGYPWTRGLWVWQYSLRNIHRFTLFAEGDAGFGNQQHVDVNHFSGWGKFQHQSIDLGVEYGYRISVYGMISAAYAHRVFAHNFPQNVNFFVLSYRVPFSLF